MRTNRTRVGFTLLEATLALTLLTVGMLGLTGVFSQIVRSNAVVRQKQAAAFLATTRLGQLRSLPLSQMGELRGTFAGPFQDYRWQAQLDYRPDNERVAILQVEVTHRSGTSVKLWTLVAIRDAQ